MQTEATKKAIAEFNKLMEQMVASAKVEAQRAAWEKNDQEMIK